MGLVAASDGTELWRPSPPVPGGMVTSVDPSSITIEGAERRAVWRMDAPASDSPATAGHAPENTRTVQTVLIAVRVRCSDLTLAEGDTTMVFADGSRRTYPKNPTAAHWYRGTAPADAVIAFVCAWTAK